MDLPIFGRRKVIQGVVRDVLVVVPKPDIGVLPDLSQGAEDVHIQHTAAVTPVEPFDEAVLHWLAGLDEAELDTMCLGPLGQRDCHELRAIIETQLLRIAPPGRDPVQHPDHARRGQVQIDLNGERLPAEVIDHVEGPEASAIPQSVRHEVR